MTNRPVISIPSLFVRPVIEKAPTGKQLIKEVYGRIKRLQMKVPLNRKYSVDKMLRVQLHLTSDNSRINWLRATILDLLVQDLNWIYGDNVDELQIACALSALIDQKKIKVVHDGLIEVLPVKEVVSHAKRTNSTNNIRQTGRSDKKDDRLQKVRKAAGSEKL